MLPRVVVIPSSSSDAATTAGLSPADLSTNSSASHFCFDWQQQLHTLLCWISLHSAGIVLMVALAQYFIFETNQVATGIVLPATILELGWVWTHPEVLEDGVGCNSIEIDDVAQPNQNNNTTNANNNNRMWRMMNETEEERNDDETKSMTEPYEDDESWNIRKLDDDDENTQEGLLL